MSRNYHSTLSDLKKLSKKEIDEMAFDDNAVFRQLSHKSKTKKGAIQRRKESRSNSNNE